MNSPGRRPRGQRDWAAHLTTLSGDIGVIGDSSDNSYHVVSGSGTNNTAFLDGFTITGGNGNTSAPNNSGGGMVNHHGSPIIANVTFSGNQATTGGGMYSQGSSPQITQSSFYTNTAVTAAGACTTEPVIPSSPGAGKRALQRQSGHSVAHQDGQEAAFTTITALPSLPTSPWSKIMPCIRRGYLCHRNVPANPAQQPAVGQHRQRNTC